MKKFIVATERGENYDPLTSGDVVVVSAHDDEEGADKSASKGASQGNTVGVYQLVKMAKPKIEWDVPE